MLIKRKFLLSVFGLMILYSFCNYVCAQEIQSQCNEGCTNKTYTYNMAGDQIKKLFGPESGGEYRYGVYATLKSDQFIWRYSEDDLTLDSFACDLGFIGYDCSDCHVPRYDKEEDIVAWCYICKYGLVWLDFYNTMATKVLPGQPIVSVRREGLTNMKIVVKIYRYRPEKDHYPDTHRRSHKGDGYAFVAG